MAKTWKFDQDPIMPMSHFSDKQNQKNCHYFQLYFPEWSSHDQPCLTVHPHCSSWYVWSFVLRTSAIVARILNSFEDAGWPLPVWLEVSNVYVEWDAWKSFHSNQEQSVKLTWKVSNIIFCHQVAHALTLYSLFTIKVFPLLN